MKSISRRSSRLTRSMSTR